MATADHPDVPFVESKTATGGPAYTRGRPDGPPIWVVVHDMEFPERTDAAEWTAQYFAGQASREGRSVSSHYCADANSIVQCVRLADTAWTVGNRPGNYRGINWELTGYASQTREQWLDEFGRAMLARVAVVMRRDMDRYGIPARTLTDVAVRTFTPGITSHWQLGRVFGGTDHTDPGAGFPWDHLLSLLTGDNDMATPSELWAADINPDPNNTHSAGGALWTALNRTAHLNAMPTLLADVAAVKATHAVMDAKLDQILAALTAGAGSGVTEAQVRDAVADLGEGGAAQVRGPQS